MEAVVAALAEGMLVVGCMVFEEVAVAWGQEAGAEEALAVAAAVSRPHPPQAQASLRSAYQITKPRLMDAAANSA